MKLIISILTIILSINLVFLHDANMHLPTLNGDSQHTKFEPNDPEYGVYQAHYLGVMDYEAIKKWGLDGAGVTVAIIDSGIVEHSDLSSEHIMKGFNYSTDNLRDVTDKTGHGTFIAGIISGITNNNKGIVGTTPMVNILPIKCFNTQLTANMEVVIKSIEKAVDSNVDVINLSLCTPVYSEELERVINEAVEKGIIVVAPSGNDYSREKRYPASFPNVISVNAINVNPVGLHVTESMTSNPNDTVTVSAPGDAILSLSYTDTDGYKQRNGSSYATAFVTSLAIMVKQYDSSLNAIHFIDLLQKTSNDYGTEGYDNIYGYGIVNYKNMINELVSREIEKGN